MPNPPPLILHFAVKSCATKYLSLLIYDLSSPKPNSSIQALWNRDDFPGTESSRSNCRKKLNIKSFHIYNLTCVDAHVASFNSIKSNLKQYSLSSLVLRMYNCKCKPVNRCLFKHLFKHHCSRFFFRIEIFSKMFKNLSKVIDIKTCHLSFNINNVLLFYEFVRV